jgi:hypothetical protein
VIEVDIDLSGIPLGFMARLAIKRWHSAKIAPLYQSNEG